MDSQTEEVIRHLHGPHVNRSVPATTLNRMNIRHLNGSAKTPPLLSSSQEMVVGPNDDRSGPSSPQHGPVRNSGVVSTGIFRSAFPFAKNLEYLKSLCLKTVVTLVDTEFDMPTFEFFRSSRIQHYRLLLPSHKQGREIRTDQLAQIMRIITNPCNHPVLIHCNKGKHRTGCVIACFRLLAAHNGRADWLHKTMGPITEYQTYSQPKSRVSDIAYITNFSPRACLYAMADIDNPIQPIDYASLPADMLPSPIPLDLPSLCTPLLPPRTNGATSPAKWLSSKIPTGQAPTQSGVQATALPTPPPTMPGSLAGSGIGSRRWSVDDWEIDDMCDKIGSLCEHGADCPLQWEHEKARDS